MEGVTSPAPRRVPRWAAFVVAAWALIAVAAMIAIWRYKLTPGPAAPTTAPSSWPSNMPLARTPGHATVVMLAHPKCPCTHASVSELAVLMARVGRTTDAYVLFVVPEGVPPGFERSDTWEQASKIPGVTVVADPRAALATRFGATVSGHTVAYDANGRLVYSGGITPSRGHEGENEGRWQIVARIEQPAPGAAGRGPTFGCELSETEPKGVR